MAATSSQRTCIPSPSAPPSGTTPMCLRCGIPGTSPSGSQSACSPWNRCATCARCQVYHGCRLGLDCISTREPEENVVCCEVHHVQHANFCPLVVSTHCAAPQIGLSSLCSSCVLPQASFRVAAHLSPTAAGPARMVFEQAVWGGRASLPGPAAPRTGAPATPRPVPSWALHHQGCGTQTAPLLWPRTATAAALQSRAHCCAVSFTGPHPATSVQCSVIAPPECRGRGSLVHGLHVPAAGAAQVPLHGVRGVRGGGDACHGAFNRGADDPFRDWNRIDFYCLSCCC